VGDDRIGAAAVHGILSAAHGKAASCAHEPRDALLAVPVSSRPELTHLLALGHRAIGFIKGDSLHSVSVKRFDGFAAAMTEFDVSTPDDLVVEGDFSVLAGLLLGEVLLGSATPPTAIFASNDDMAVGMLMTAMKRGLMVPQYLSSSASTTAPDRARRVAPAHHDPPAKSRDGGRRD